jgi:WhiB family transcriptional regulator, redox-sensing transcriptional regulator
MNPGPPSEPARSGTRCRAARPARGPAFLPPPTWMRDAACAATDPELFFPDSRSPASEAKEICASCPVRPECLEYSLAAAEEFGVWGGLTEKERRKLLRTDHAQPEQARPHGKGAA